MEKMHWQPVAAKSDVLDDSSTDKSVPPNKKLPGQKKKLVQKRKAFQNQKKRKDKDQMSDRAYKKAKKKKSRFNLGEVPVPELSGIGTVISVPSDGNDGFYSLLLGMNDRTEDEVDDVDDTPPPRDQLHFRQVMQTLAGDYHDVLFRGGVSELVFPGWKVKIGMNSMMSCSETFMGKMLIMRIQLSCSTKKGTICLTVGICWIHS
jgi:hypothetical protein